MSESPIRKALILLAAILFSSGCAYLSPRWRSHPLKAALPPGPAITGLIRDLTKAEAQTLITRPWIGNGRYRPEPAHSTPEQRAQLLRAFEELPAEFLRLVKPHFRGFLLCKNLGSTGMMEPLPGGGFVIVVDVTRLRANLAGWRNEQEELMFWEPEVPHADVSITTVLKRTEVGPHTPVRVTGTHWILLHELAHVLAFASPEDVAEEFATISWYMYHSRLYTRYTARHYPAPQWLQNPFRGNPTLKGVDPRVMYEWLENSPYPTLYAHTRPEEDFAESLASYVVEHLWKIQRELVVTSPGQLPHRFKTCWASTACDEKRRFFDALLKPSADRH